MSTYSATIRKQTWKNTLRFANLRLKLNAQCTCSYWIKFHCAVILFLIIISQRSCKAEPFQSFFVRIVIEITHCNFYFIIDTICYILISIIVIIIIIIIVIVIFH